MKAVGLLEFYIIGQWSYLAVNMLHYSRKAKNVSEMVLKFAGCHCYHGLKVHRPRGWGCVCLGFIGQWHILGFRSASSSQDQGLELPPMAEWSGPLTRLRGQSHHTGRPGEQSIEPKIILEPKTLK